MYFQESASPKEANTLIDIVKLVIDLVDSMIWPVVLLFILWFFSKEFKGIFKRLESFDLSKDGIKLTTFEQKLSKLQSISDIVSEPKGTSKPISPPDDPDTGTSKVISPPDDPDDGTSKSISPPDDPDESEGISTSSDDAGEEIYFPSDPKLRVTKVRFELESKLMKKAKQKGIKVPDNMETLQLASLLNKNGALQKGEFQIVEGLVELSDGVLAGLNIDRNHADGILDLYKKLP